ncbi:DNA primase [Alcanivorax sp. JB21]|uniref:DNA primase n=1 Tax=Alcanivorax limicola TaxID=2874102 RepID=UPI001CBE52FF|nr:DNA primase [Alcanivorax limicola]MBZ2190097.1 DNA primase [Alcanivorax limicola]
MSRIPEAFVQDLLARTDLVELIDARVPLKKTGRNYSACCPFHNEKTPSFTVAPDKQFYYCFGCGAKGNAVGFLMEYEHLSFPEAVKQLADKAGVEVPRERPETAQDVARKDQVQRILDLLSRADRYYRQQLKSAPERQSAVTYLKGRGLSGTVAARFGLGFAPPGFDNLMTSLSLDQPGLDLALEAGLLVRRDDTGRTYDKFRDRIMFPIRDTRGRTIGFGGRLLGDGKPKYLNSPETPVFHKGRELYGLWEWRQSRDKSPQLFVVEGYMDVIALAQHGIDNAVATLGTATTEDHAQKLFRQVDEVVFCFDGDNAGRNAAWRALESALATLEDGKQARFLFLPDGEDPDTLVRTQGREALLAMAAEAPSLSEFLFRHLEEGLDVRTVDGRARLARLALPYIQKVRGDFYRSLLRRELADRTRLTEEELERLTPAPAPRASAGGHSGDRSGNPHSNSSYSAAPPRQHFHNGDLPPAPPPEDYASGYADSHDNYPGGDMPPADIYGGTAGQAAPPSRFDDRAKQNTRPAPRAPAQRPRGSTLSLGERMTLMLLNTPTLIREKPLPEGVEELELPQLDLLFQVSALVRDNPDLPPAALMGSLMALEQGETLARLLRETLRAPMDETTTRRYWHDAIQQLEVRRLEAAIAHEVAQAKPDARRLSELTRALSSARLSLSMPLDQAPMG